jgi:hypothetical protein
MLSKQLALNKFIDLSLKRIQNFSAKSDSCQIKRNQHATRVVQMQTPSTFVHSRRPQKNVVISIELSCAYKLRLLIPRAHSSRPCRRTIKNRI